MAGRPLRRARLAAQAHAEAMRVRGGEEPMQNIEPYSLLTDPPPVRHIDPSTLATTSMPPPPRRIGPSRTVVPVAIPAKAPPLTEAEARMFAEARNLSLTISLNFLKRNLDDIYDPKERFKAEMKQLEIAQSVLSLGGRIDPATMRGTQTDEVGEMLDSIKAQGPVQ